MISHPGHVFALLIRLLDLPLDPQRNPPCTLPTHLPFIFTPCERSPSSGTLSCRFVDNLLSLVLTSKQPTLIDMSFELWKEWLPSLYFDFVQLAPSYPFVFPL